MAKTKTDVWTRAREHTDAAIAVLAEIMQDRSAPQAARVAAATEILNRGLGALVDPTQFGPISGAFYVYSIHDDEGRLLYIGKGSGNRHLVSAKKIGGKSRIRAEFAKEGKALAFEARLIRRFNPPANTTYAVH